MHVKENVEGSWWSVFSSQFHVWSNIYTEFIFKITIKLGFKFLDAGYGTVNTTTAVAKKVGDSGLVMRCDPDKSRTEIAQKKCFL